MKNITVAIYDLHDLYREMLAAQLEDKCDFIVLSNTYTQLKEFVREMVLRRPTVLIVSYSMQHPVAFDLIRAAKKFSPKVPVLFCSFNGAKELNEEALSVGADETLNKGEAGILDYCKIIKQMAIKK
jgi:DNA-binding NarL/FixJ family response regulator